MIVANTHFAKSEMSYFHPIDNSRIKLSLLSYTHKFE
jgi:hypothetical protein